MPSVNCHPVTHSNSLNRYWMPSTLVEVWWRILWCPRYRSENELAISDQDHQMIFLYKDRVEHCHWLSELLLIKKLNSELFYLYKIISVNVHLVLMCSQEKPFSVIVSWCSCLFSSKIPGFLFPLFVVRCILKNLFFIATVCLKLSFNWKVKLSHSIK